MPYRLAGKAEDRLDEMLLESAREWGIEGAGRYHRLVLAAMNAIGDTPALRGSRPVPRLTGVRTLHLRSARRFLASEPTVGRPRHLIVYRVAADNVVEILGFVHDRMLLERAVRRVQSEAER